VDVGILQIGVNFKNTEVWRKTLRVNYATHFLPHVTIELAVVVAETPLKL